MEERTYKDLLETYESTRHFHGSDKGVGCGYIEAYNQHLQPLKDQPVVFCELGVQHGSSMVLWDRFFTHPETIIYGVDYNPASQLDELISLLSPRVQLLNFNYYTIEDTILENTKFDCVLDDGDKDWRMQKAAFKNFWPRIKPRGKMIIEDVDSEHLLNLLDLDSSSIVIDQRSQPRSEEWGGGYYLPTSLAVVYTKVIVQKGD